jgi:uncharacterized protein
MMRFDVSALLKAQLGQSLTLNVDTGPQALGELKVDYLRGTVRVFRIQNGLYVEGTVQSQLWLECVRCLEPFASPMALELEETFRLSETDPRLYIPYAISDDGWLDLAPLLREQAWLTIPMKPLCRLDCKGLCPQCGADLNHELCTCERVQIDPRLAVLKELL